MGENEEAVSSLMKAAVPLDSVETLFRQGIESSSKDSDRDLLIAQLTYQAALGRIRLQQGETRDAEEAFLAVRSRTPYNPRVYNGPLRQSLQGLASLAGKTGDNDKVLDFLIEQSFLQEKSTEFWDRLKATYRTTHQNSLDGLTETLDARYQKLLPNPVHPQPYRPTPARSDRTVLAEVFTGTWCPPCAATTLAFDAFLERYSRTDLILLVYHVWNDDPMQNPSSLSRLDYYKVNGIPDILVDGVSTGLDGDSRDKTPEVYGRIQPFIERQLETEAHGEINLNATRVNSTIEVKVTPKASGNRANLRLHIVLVEEMLRYSGRNYTRFHPMVVRNVAGEGARGIPMKESGETVSWRFDLSAIVQQNEKALNENERRLIHSIDKSLLEINSNNLTVVAFLQDETTKQVLQAVSQRVKP
jgi:thiol-disulfide isomerase/thioredoxin